MPFSMTISSKFAACEEGGGLGESRMKAQQYGIDPTTQQQAKFESNLNIRMHELSLCR